MGMGMMMRGKRWRWSRMVVMGLNGRRMVIRVVRVLIEWV